MAALVLRVTPISRSISPGVLSSITHTSMPVVLPESPGSRTDKELLVVNDSVTPVDIDVMKVICTF